MNRRTVLKTLALASAAAALPHTAPGQAPAASASVAAPTNGPFSLAPLPYAPEALEPHLDAQTMTLHHGKHHAAYVNNLNKAVAADAKAFPTLDPVGLIQQLNQVPESIRTLVRNNGGGHVNHTLFWQMLSPAGQGGKPSAKLAQAIETDLGGMAALQKALTDSALKVFGSGWAWLSVNPAGKLVIENTSNQDSPIMQGNKPLLGLDVWEHAYYLKYQNKRADYLAALFQVISWDFVSKRLEAKI